jgi:selenocysteine lyase/cysteine desulfurase
MLESFFSTFRDNIIGNRQRFESPLGAQEILYADWTASGRAYRPIEEKLQNDIMPFVANTHTASTVTGQLMTNAYAEAKAIIKQHVNADSNHTLLFCGSGMTAAVNKLQRILGIRIPERLADYLKPSNKYPSIKEALRPVVFITHMEHHSNQLSWLETIATVEIINPDKDGNVDLVHFAELLEQHKHRKNKIAAVTACSNVTGIETPYHEMAKLVHQYGGLCFVDFACSAPYVEMNMQPGEKGAHLDAIYFSPHKFLGGPGTPGLLIFSNEIYKNTVPDHPGGGTVSYSNPWAGREYVNDIEHREDGGTPPFLQGIKAAMCIKLKDAMGVERMRRREEEMLHFIFERFSKMENVVVLAANNKIRLGVISFIIKAAHYNLVVKILNDRFGIQTRGGCSCAGTYGHFLLNVDELQSHDIWSSIRSGNLFCKPGWVRLSIHPTMTNAEMDFLMGAIELTALHFEEWGRGYVYDAGSNEYTFAGFDGSKPCNINNWFNFQISDLTTIK